jgi:hypothetical protein
LWIFILKDYNENLSPIAQELKDLLVKYEPKLRVEKNEAYIIN